MRRAVIGTFVAAAIVAGFACFFSCTTKKERPPGPLTVWLLDDPEARVTIESLTAGFKDAFKVPVDISFKGSYEMTVALRDHRDEVVGKVDLIELNVEDIQEFAPLMQDSGPAAQSASGYKHVYPGVAKEGFFRGAQSFVPFRMVWPAQVSKSDVRTGGDWRRFLRTAQRHSGMVIIPGLEDRELAGILYSVALEFDANLLDPEDSKLQNLFSWMESVSETLMPSSGAVGSGDIADWPADERPDLWIEYPKGLTPLSLEGAFQLGYKAEPLPCDRKSCKIFAYGTYIGILDGAPHQEDATRYLQMLISSSAQQDLVFTSPMLPIRTDGWGNLAARRDGYEPLTETGPSIVTKPEKLKKVERALAGAGRLVLFEGKNAEEGLEEYKSLLVSK